MSGLTDRLSFALQELDEALGEARFSLEHLTVDDQIVVGRLLWMADSSIAGVLDPIKGNLRKEAILKNGGKSGPCKLGTAEDSGCTVNIPTPAISLRKDVNISDLKQKLGSLFDSLIETVVTYKPKPGIRTKTASIPDQNAQQALLGSLGVDPGTPKVFFKP